MEIDILHIVVNFVGAVAVLFLLLSVSIFGEFYMRVGLIFSSVWFILYGALISGYEFIISAVALGVINSWKLYELLNQRLTKRVERFFTYDNQQIRK